MTVDPYSLLRRRPFALVDPLASESVSADLPAEPLRPYWFRGDPSPLPVLVDLRQLTDDQVGRILQQSDTALRTQQAPDIRMLLLTGVDKSGLRAHLLDSLTVRHHGKPGLLRFYDPKTWLHLEWMLTPEQMAGLLGPVVSLAFWWSDAWHLREHPSIPVDTVADQPLATVRIGRIGAINDVLANLDMPLPPETIMAAGPQIEQALSRAEAHALHDEDDRIAFATHAMRVHPRFDAHPRIAALLAALDEHTTYRDSAALLDAADWQAIREDLHGEHKTRSVLQ